MDHCQEAVDQLRIELPIPLTGDFRDGIGDRPGRFVRALLGQRVEHVGHSHDPAGQRDGIALQPLVPFAVPVLMVAERNLFCHPQQAEAASREDPRADRRVRLDERELCFGELPELQQDRVGDSDLADVVQGRRTTDQGHCCVGQPDLPRDQGGHAAHAFRVLSRVVVAELRGTCQAFDDLDLRRFELAGPLADLRLEHLVLALDLKIQEARFEQRADPEQDLVAVERFVDEVLGAARQRLSTDLGRHVARQHQDWQIARFGKLVQTVEHFQTVHVRHVQVQQDQIGAEPHVEVGCLAGIVGALDPREPAPLEEPAQHVHVRDFVVHDEDPRVPEGPRDHHRRLRFT